MSSILTNNSAMTALRSLQDTNKGLGVTQNRVSTGLKVNDAGDNAARWSVAATMRAESSGYGVLGETQNVALAATQQALDTIENLRVIYTSISDKAAEMESATGDAKTALAAEISGLESAASSLVTANLFNDVNLIGGDSYSVTVDMAGNSHTVTAQDLTSMTAVTDMATAKTALGELKTAAEGLGADKQALQAYQKFAKSSEHALKAGTGALVDADMTEESARLSALQVQQQLGAQAMSIANQAPQVLLSLFR
ncbi:MAG: hypothetical protein VR70_02410 [Rhodospirillaceae bacterium BRH_c57]|nr:MAG: hypothetical protein VR70_02410 [Rhodospirillaceae bacterium BRH_c57]